jgi:tetratricopeptide (TPR) repeat protein
MHTIQFWKSWNKPYQIFFWFLCTLLILSLVFFWYSYLTNPAPVITWQYFQELQLEEIPIRSFQVGLETIQVKADNLMIYETQSGSPLQPNTASSYIFLSALVITILVLLTICTLLSRFWFMVGMGIFSLFVISLQPEAMMVFGLTNKIPVASMLILIAGLGYYFHAFRNETGFFIRLLSFTILFIILGAIVVGFSQTQDPFLHLSVNGYSLGLILTLVFILMVGPEIPAAFINVVTQGTRQTKSLRHFLIITSVYLINLLIVYSLKIGYLDWNIWAIDIFFLFTLSSILGIWGFRQREPQYASIFSADPFGIYFILAMMLISVTTIAYFLSTANDTVIIVLRDVILYSHIGYGLIFLAYILSNFGAMLSNNLQVYKVLYKPKTMQYFTFRLMGLITCFGFLIFDTNWRTPINQIYAGYYASYGDLYLAQGDDQLAEGFYNKSIFHRNQNHHAHYALASIYATRLEAQKEKQEFAEASASATEFAFINLSDAYQRTGDLLESIMVLNEAKKSLPESGVIYNSLGLAFSKLKMSDSALFSFQKARTYSSMKEMAETNLLATSARFKLSYPADSLLQLIGSQSEGPKANALALANMQNLPIEIDFTLGADTILSATKVTFLCNYFINQPTKIDTALLSKAVALARKPSNDYFKEVIIVAASHAYYQQGQIRRAFDLTRQIAYSSGSGKYFSLLGTWALEQNNPQIAANYFLVAKDKNQPKALFNEALSYTEADSIPVALNLWDSLTRSNDSIQNATASIIKRSLTATPSQVMSFTDEEKYLFCRYKIDLTDTALFWTVNSSIQKEELKAQAILDFSKKWFALDEAPVAYEILKKVKGLRLASKSTYDEIIVLNLMLLADFDSETFIKQSLDNLVPLKNSFPNQVVYLQALQHQYAERMQEARAKFEHLSQANIHFEEGLVASAKFFSADTTDRLKSYSIVVSGLVARPHSIKLLKAYVKEAALVGFDDEADESLTKLRELLPPRSFNRYVKENPDFFDIED